MSRKNDQPPADVGALIRAARERIGMSRNALAVRAGVDSAYLLRIERGDVTAPSWYTVCALADGLGVSTEDLRPARGGRNSEKNSH